jgi:hypothetical protein
MAFRPADRRKRLAAQNGTGLDRSGPMSGATARLPGKRVPQWAVPPHPPISSCTSSGFPLFSQDHDDRHATFIPLPESMPRKSTIGRWREKMKGCRRIGDHVLAEKAACQPGVAGSRRPPAMRGRVRWHIAVRALPEQGRAFRTCGWRTYPRKRSCQKRCDCPIVIHHRCAACGNNAKRMPHLWRPFIADPYPAWYVGFFSFARRTL